MLWSPGGERSGPFFPPPPAPAWSMVGQEGSAAVAGAAAGPPGTYSGIHTTAHPWHPVGGLRATSGRGGCSPLAPTPQPASYRGATAHGISPPMSHMKQFLGQREREHTSEVGVKSWAWQMNEVPSMRRGSSGHPRSSLRSGHQEKGAIGCVVGGNCCPPHPCQRPLLPAV